MKSRKILTEMSIDGVPSRSLRGGFNRYSFCVRHIGSEPFEVIINKSHWEISLSILCAQGLLDLLTGSSSMKLGNF